MSSGERPEGWAVPVHASLTQPQLILGMPRGFAIVLSTAVMIITMPMNLWFVGLPLGLIFWVLGATLTRWDEAWFEAGHRHLIQPGVLGTL